MSGISIWPLWKLETEFGEKIWWEEAHFVCEFEGAKCVSDFATRPSELSNFKIGPPLSTGSSQSESSAQVNERHFRAETRPSWAPKTVRPSSPETVISSFGSVVQPRGSRMGVSGAEKGGRHLVWGRIIRIINS